MKYIGIFVFMFCFSGLWGQAADTTVYELYDVETPAQFPGGSGSVCAALAGALGVRNE